MRDQHYLELVRKVTMYLDNELNESAERELLREIQSNPAYFKVLSQEKSFREFIKNKIHRRKPSPALIQSIKEKNSRSARLIAPPPRKNYPTTYSR